MVLFTLSVSACYLTSDLDGFAGSPDEGPAPATDAEAGPIDAESGSSQIDSPAESTVDAACDATLCDDFERADLLGSWDGRGDSKGGSSRLSASPVRSGVKALEVSLTSDEGSTAGLHRTFAAGTKVELTYWLYLSESPDRSLSLGDITYVFAGSTSRTVKIFQRVLGGNLLLVEQEFVNGAQTFYVQSAPLPLVLGRWTPVVLEVMHGVSASSARASYGGQVLFDGALVKSYSVSAPPQIVTGASFAAAGRPVSFSIDDVRVTTTP